jgi:hypothetical protein
MALVMLPEQMCQLEIFLSGNTRLGKAATQGLMPTRHQFIWKDQYEMSGFARRLALTATE